MNISFSSYTANIGKSKNESPGQMECKTDFYDEKRDIKWRVGERIPSE